MVVCPGNTELEDFLNDRQPAEYEERILAHLESCSVCQGVLENLTSGTMGPRGEGELAHFEPPPRSDKPYPLPPQIGQYTLVRELGQGGMGVVYLAEQTNLKRAVALKIIRHGVNATPQEVARFCAEAQAIAQLQHPNIVQIHEVGSQEGVFFFALEYVNGDSLDRLLSGTPQDPGTAAQLVETLARAVHHAHQRGILHRDLKPGNILLQRAASGQRDNATVNESLSPAIGSAAPCLPLSLSELDLVPKITDFGLAKRLEANESRTQSGMVMGTPSYMAPEQVSAGYGDITVSVDVYGLGALLYELLTGRPPFKGATPLATLEQLLAQEPLPPSKFQRNIPVDLETICLKCLEKEQSKRYKSAEALADDLGRFLAGQPIHARPIRTWGRVWKWIRRRPLEACLVAAIVLVAVVGLTGVLWQWRTSVVERDLARRAWYRANIAAATLALAHNSLSARQSLEDAPAEFRNWEWRHFSAQLDNAAAVLTGHEGPILDVAFSNDGGRLFSVSEDRTLRVWETPQVDFEIAQNAQGKSAIAGTRFAFNPGRQLAVARGHAAAIETLALSPDGSRLATGSDDHTVRIWDARSGQPLAECRGHTAPVRALAFSPDGRRLVSGCLGDDQCRMWDTANGNPLMSLPGAAAVRGLLFTPDGTRLILCGNDTVRILDAASGNPLVVRKVAGGLVCCTAISPDGRILATGWDYPDSAVRLWDLTDGHLILCMNGHQNRVNSVAFSPDGSRLASTSKDQTVRLWDVAAGKTAAVLRGHTGHVRQALFSPDGSRLISAANDGTLRSWDPVKGELISVLRGHSEGVCAFAFGAPATPGGKARLASVSFDRSVRLWDLAMVEGNGVLRGHESYVYDAAFSPDGERIASAAWDNSVRLWDATSGRQTALVRALIEEGADPSRGARKPQTASGQVALPMEGEGPCDAARGTVHGAPGTLLLSLAFAPDGAQLATGSRDSKVRFWDAKRCELRHAVQLPGSGVDSLAFSPDGTVLAAALGDTFRGLKSDANVLLLDAGTGATLRTMTGHTEPVLTVRFAPDGKRLVSAGFDGTVRVWNSASGDSIAILTGHAAAVAGVAFTVDGTVLATASHDRTVRLWNARSLRPIAVLPHASTVYCVAFSPDGTRLAAGCDDNTIRLWDVPTRQEVAELRGHNAYVHAVAFSPDGTRLVSASGDFTVRVWDTLSSQQRFRNSAIAASPASTR